jgi:hypothetical protein
MSWMKSSQFHSINALLPPRIDTRCQPHRFVFFIDQFFEYLWVAHVGFRRFVVRHQLFFGIHFHVILVSKVHLIVLICPAHIAIFLPHFCASLLKSFRPFPLLDLFVFLPAISLLRRIHKSGIHDTPLPPYQPSLGQHLLKSLEQLPGTIPAIPFQCLLEIPDRSRIRYRVSGMQSQKYHETKSIPHLKLALLIAQTVILLQYQHVEH